MKKEIVYLIIASVFFSLFGIFVNLIKDDFHPLAIGFYRLLLVVLFISTFLWYTNKKFHKINYDEFRGYFLIGLFVAINVISYTTAFYNTSIHMAVILNYTFPIFVILLSYLILKDNVSPTFIYVYIVTFIGIVIINFQNDFGNLYGNILSLLAALSYALMIVFVKKNNLKNSIKNTVWFYGIAMILLLPFVFIYGVGTFSLFNVVILLLMGITSGISFLLFNLALRTVSSNTVSIVDLLISPLITILIALSYFQEELTLSVFFGGVLILCSGLYVFLYNSRKENKNLLN